MLSSLRLFEHEVRADALLGEFVLLDRAVFRLPGTTTAILGCSLFLAVASREPGRYKPRVGRLLPNMQRVERRHAQCRTGARPGVAERPDGRAGAGWERRRLHYRADALEHDTHFPCSEPEAPGKRHHDRLLDGSFQ
jgi:hypothetical protein